MQRKYTVDQIKNQKFGKLTAKQQVRKISDGGTHRLFWLCECECGRTVERRTDYLVRSNGSCGCAKRQLEGNQHALWKGAGDIPGQYINTIEFRCRRYNIEFDATKEYLWHLFQQQNGRCALTNLPLQFSTLRAQKRGRPQTASLDRIDSTRGYVVGNLQWLHKDVNMMKKEYPQERFLEICKLVVAKAA